MKEACLSPPKWLVFGEISVLSHIYLQYFSVTLCYFSTKTAAPAPCLSQFSMRWCWAVRTTQVSWQPHACVTSHHAAAHLASPHIAANNYLKKKMVSFRQVTKGHFLTSFSLSLLWSLGFIFLWVFSNRLSSVQVFKLTSYPPSGLM